MTPMGLQVIAEVEEPKEKWYRHVSKGAWPFSSRDHGWPIADCSAEGLKARPYCPSKLRYVTSKLSVRAEVWDPRHATQASMI